MKTKRKALRAKALSADDTDDQNRQRAKGSGQSGDVLSQTPEREILEKMTMFYPLLFALCSLPFVSSA